MKRMVLCLFMILGSTWALAQLRYTLRYTESTRPYVVVSIEPSTPLPSSVQFIMPRSIPGSYSISRYDLFLDSVVAINSQGRHIPMTRHSMDAPRWEYKGQDGSLLRIEYRVNIDKMERQNTPSDASLLRPGFAGILNYSVFGWIEGLDREPLECRVETGSDWPIFSTNAPSVDLASGSLVFKADDYPALADGQIFMGPRFRVKSYQGKTPLYVVSYAQTSDEYLDDYGSMGVECMGILNNYFGELPFPHYSLVLSKALQQDGRVAPAFAMEHRNSSTFFGDTSGIQTMPLTPDLRSRRINSILHHMAHAYIPLRAYAGKYRPRPLEIPPLIETIWMNEGFAWFLLYDVLRQPRLLELFRSSVYETAPEIKSLSLFDLSYLASTLYAVDFRTGRAIFSRGALMALEMDERIRSQSGSKKGMKDVLRYIYHYAKTNPLPIPVEQLPVLMSRACGVELGDIYRKWLAKVE